MAQVYNHVTHLANRGDIFLLPYEPRTTVERVRDFGWQVEYLLEDGNGYRYPILVDKPEVEHYNSERDRAEYDSELYVGAMS